MGDPVVVDRRRGAGGGKSVSVGVVGGNSFKAIRGNGFDKESPIRCCNAGDAARDEERATEWIDFGEALEFGDVEGNRYDEGFGGVCGGVKGESLRMERGEVVRKGDPSVNSMVSLSPDSSASLSPRPFPLSRIEIGELGDSGSTQVNGCSNGL